jgi:hypothetical protein
VEVVPTERQAGERALLALQVTSRSPMGAVALESGGLLIDHGWLRLLGAGSARMTGSLLTWNGLAGPGPEPPLAGALLVAHDALGGFFALNGDPASGRAGKLSYFPPDALRWEDLDLGYSDFLAWSTTDRLGQFYASLRWPGWERDTAALSPDQGFSVYPFLWAEGPPIEERSRRAVPMTELWGLHHDLARQMHAGGNA